jgi:hypothetical protein
MIYIIFSKEELMDMEGCITKMGRFLLVSLIKAWQKDKGILYGKMDHFIEVK